MQLKLPRLATSQTPWWIWLVLVAWIGWQAKQYGEALERARQLRALMDKKQVVIDSLVNVVKQADSIVRTLRVEVDSTKAQVVIVDKTVQPQIDSAVVALGATLDSTQKIQLAVIETAYNARLAVRDSMIASLVRLTDRQDSLSQAKDSVIVALRDMNKQIYAAWENSEKRHKTAGWRRVVDVGIAVGLVFIGSKVN